MSMGTRIQYVPVFVFKRDFGNLAVILSGGKLSLGSFKII